MNILFWKKIVVTSTIIFFATAVIIAVLSLFHPHQQNSTPPSLQTQFPPVSSDSLSVIKYSPLQTQPLMFGQTQNFILTFNKTISANMISISFSGTPIGSATSQPVPISIKYNGNSVTIKVTTLLQPNTAYSLIIQNSTHTSIIFSKIYTTTSPTPTPVPNNNHALIQYLPYQTSTWTLYYNSSNNIYYFNLIPNLNSSIDLETQFQNAQNDALQFIKSKGIDPSTLVIEWKH